MDININKLYYFYVVAKEGSVKSASKKLHLTQPTISAQIKQLEEQLGFDLFIRKHRKLELNRNGNYVLRKAEKLFTIADELIHSLPKRGKAERTRLRIGAIQSLSNSFIYDFSLKLWSDDSIRVSVVQGALSDLLKKMERDELDLIVTDGPYTRSKKLKSTFLGPTKIVVVANPKLEIDKKGFPKCLNSHPYLAFSNQGRLQEDIDYFFERMSIYPEKIGEVDDVTLLKVITESTNCFTILPERAARESIKEKKLKSYGELKGVGGGLWALFPSLSANKILIKRILSDYHKRVSKP